MRALLTDVNTLRRQDVRGIGGSDTEADLPHRTEAYAPLLVEVGFIDPCVRDQLVVVGSPDRHRSRRVLARQKEVDRAVVVEVAGGDVLERRRRKQVELPCGQRRDIEYLRGDIPALD